MSLKNQSGEKPVNKLFDNWISYVFLRPVTGELTRASRRGRHPEGLPGGERRADDVGAHAASWGGACPSIRVTG